MYMCVLTPFSCSDRTCLQHTDATLLEGTKQTPRYAPDPLGPSPTSSAALRATSLGTTRRPRPAPTSEAVLDAGLPLTPQRFARPHAGDGDGDAGSATRSVHRALTARTQARCGASSSERRVAGLDWRTEGPRGMSAVRGDDMDGEVFRAG